MLTDEGMGAAGGVGESLLEELGHSVHTPEIDGGGEPTSAPLLHGAGAPSAEEVREEVCDRQSTGATRVAHSCVGDVKCRSGCQRLWTRSLGVLREAGP
jgi:hypothetical protein